ncbi:ABC transporter ATP-binding protein [Aeromicrobium ginsengisoli]|uniref:ATP-binding cassette domain-containing protein n=1 Tax=Aeromicrobium ginsengisoli TaxID=363867 RepID=A0A5M4F8W4_9ACTN|nr:ATP-binding cassette domain-containing protein [Aeromicrobium ginsengisoli]KAA1394217.1 ATP-binding cassette domain-containing protein [Aeromicrobium ginsengisoli]
MTASSAAIRATGITAGYGSTPAIHGVDLRVAPGEMAALVGANGAGKTTILSTIAGELVPFEGEIEVLGNSKRRGLDHRARHGLGFLTEGRCVFMQLTGWENLAVGRGPVDKALEYFPELEPHLRKKAGLLSGGQQQMLALARILAGEPRVLLADELSLGLAPLVVQRLLTTLREAADRGVAILLVEQHVSQALAIADKGYVLSRGRMVMSGTAAELQASADEIAGHYLTGNL